MESVVLNPFEEINLPRTYALAAKEQPEAYWNSEMLKIKWSSLEDYRVVHKVGRGKYSEVFEGLNTANKSKVCIKVLKPVSRNRILKEVKVLQNLCEGPNIVRLLDVARDEASKTPCLIFEYINNTHYRELFSERFTDLDLRYYMYQLLRALDYSHSQGIMHRDVKPQNIMFDY